MRVVIALAGRKGSGKSTIALQLQDRYGFVHTSFGRVVRAVAAARSLLPETPVLEALGRELIQDWGWLRFCREVLGDAEDAQKIVVDGIRHVEAVTTLRQLTSPALFALAFVELDESERLRRLSIRANRSNGPVINDDRMVEDLDSLRNHADIVVSGQGVGAAEKILAKVQPGRL